MILIALHVDDMLITVYKASELIFVKAELCKHFKMNELGKADEFLGFRIARSRPERTLHLSKTEYIDKVVERFGISKTKTSANPMEIPPTKSFPESIVDLLVQAPYHEAVGSLIWLMIGICPDIVHAVGTLSQKCKTILTLL